MAQELVKGTGPVNVMISAKEEDDLIRQQYNSALRPDAGELQTCWRYLARITLDHRRKRWQTRGLWMNKLARQPSKLL